MSIEGRVTIDLGADGASAVHVEYRQPLQVAGIVRGKTPQAAAAIFPLVYSVCGNAQAHAAALALEAAAGIAGDPATANARAILTALESWRESLLRVVADWPAALGEPADLVAARPAMNYLARMKAALFGDGDPFALGAVAVPDQRNVLAIVAEAEQLAGELVFGEASERFLARCGQSGLLDWSNANATPAALFLRKLEKTGWANEAAIDAEALELPQAPGDIGQWLAFAKGERIAPDAGAVPETTLYSRRRKQEPVAGLRSGAMGARYAARLAELARLPLEMRDLAMGRARPAAYPGTAGGYGIAVVDAARGLLTHAVRLEAGRVADYRVVSPTDWNFHARGIAARCLATLGDRENRIEMAHLVIRAIDPCVAYEMRAG